MENETTTGLPVVQHDGSLMFYIVDYSAVFSFPAKTIDPARDHDCIMLWAGCHRVVNHNNNNTNKNVLVFYPMEKRHLIIKEKQAESTKRLPNDPGRSAFAPSRGPIQSSGFIKDIDSKYKSDEVRFIDPQSTDPSGTPNPQDPPPGRCDNDKKPGVEVDLRRGKGGSEGGERS